MTNEMAAEPEFMREINEVWVMLAPTCYYLLEIGNVTYPKRVPGTDQTKPGTEPIRVSGNWSAVESHQAARALVEKTYPTFQQAPILEPTHTMTRYHTGQPIQEVHPVLDRYVRFVDLQGQPAS